jgi:U32 family peptidase
MPGSMPELLAPAGHVEGFQAAVESGADAIYLGLKQLSARASAINFSLEEVALLVPYARKRHVAVYVALNSLVAASEVQETLDLLQSLSDMEVDGLIVQDPGIFYLVRRWFPKIKLHASTLTTAHNHAGVNQLARMGADRVVLARELGLEEIEQIASRTKVDLELFVHGALCFSYSGMCLASSYRGGHSGLRGRCVQPCRLQFRQGRKEGYFLSCSDFSALPLIPRLKRLRIASFKIEGRMKSADYIAQVVRAYRLVLDAAPGEEKAAIAQGQEWLTLSPSRRLTAGYLTADAGAQVLAPHRSGSSGLWAATVQEVSGGRATVLLRHDLCVGDRLRPESKESREEEWFEVRGLKTREGEDRPRGLSGERMILTGSAKLTPGARLFKVGRKAASPQALWKGVRREIQQPLKFRTRFQGGPDRGGRSLGSSPHRDRQAILVFKVGDVKDLMRSLELPVQQVMLTATPENLERMAKIKLVPRQKQKFSWSLPPLIAEKQMDYYRAAVAWYRKSGYTRWELNNWAHFDFFQDGDPKILTAGYRFNVRNLAALNCLADLHCERVVLSVEITRSELEILAQAPWPADPVLCVFAWPPLFASRLKPGLDEERPFFTPRKEAFRWRRKGEFSLIHADRPYNWFGHLDSFRSLGFHHHMVDLSEAPGEGMPPVESLLQSYMQGKSVPAQPLFNLDRRP